MGHDEVEPRTSFDTQCWHVRGSRILAYGYSDGPTSGFLQCAECGGEFLFDLIDVDEREESRE